MRQLSRRRNRDRGIALLLALLVLIILALLVTQMTVSALHNRTVAGNHLADLQNAYGTRSGFHQAALFLEADLEEAPDVDSLRERWAQPIPLETGRASVLVTVADSARRLNLSAMTDEKGEVVPEAAERLRRLVRVLGHTPDLADRILDYLDADHRGEFETGARNEKLFGLDELLRIEGMPPEAVYGGWIGGEQKRGLRDFLTVWPREGGADASKINLNTAPVEVLQCLSDEIGEGLAGAIVLWRETPGPDGRLQEFAQPDELKKVPGLTDQVYQTIAGQLAVKATTFEIRARSRVGNVEKTWVYVVSREAAAPPAEGAAPGAPPPPAGRVTLLAAHPLHDFLSVAPEEEPR